MANVLIIRISSIGDVAMTIPVIYSVAKDNPSDSFTVLTQEFLLPVFMNKPENVYLFGINKKGSEKSIWGMIRMTFQLTKNKKYDLVIDLHNVIRSWVIDLIFFLRGARVFLLDKNRKERKKLTRRPPKEIKPLRAMIASYADVFRRAGFQFHETFTSLFDKEPVAVHKTGPIAGEKKGKWIGVAPFAGFNGKIYPVEEMEKVVYQLSRLTDVTIYLLGGKGYEEAVLDEWAFQYMHTYNVAGKFSLEKELALISRLDVLVSMDSANMHFASLVNTPVISFWGATHPYAGFYGFRQSPEGIVQADIACRPCSVFGNKPCHRGDWACLQVAPELIVEKVKKYLSLL